MDEPVLEIPQKIYGNESQVITLRITSDMLTALDSAARESKRSRNEILTMALEFSLEHMVLSDKIPEDHDGSTLIIPMETVVSSDDATRF